MLEPWEIAKLWQKHAGGLTLLARTRCQSDAEDLVQEAYIKLAAQVAAPDDPKAWLARVVRNLAIDRDRVHRRRRRREQVFAETNAAWFESELPTNDQPNVSEIKALLQELEVVDREIVVAHIWNGLSFREVATVFDLPSSTVHRRYTRALKQLRRQLGNRKETEV